RSRAGSNIIEWIFLRIAVQPLQELIELAKFLARFFEVHLLQSFEMPLLETRIFIRDIEEADQPAEFRIALMFRLIFGWHVAESKFANRILVSIGNPFRNRSIRKIRQFCRI